MTTYNELYTTTIRVVMFAYTPLHLTPRYSVHHVVLLLMVCNTPTVLIATQWLGACAWQ